MSGQEVDKQFILTGEAKKTSVEVGPYLTQQQWRK